MKKAVSKTSGQTGTIPADMEARLRAVAAMPDEAIDLTDPDAPDVHDWTGAIRGRFYRPVKELKSLRLDADVLAYFQADGPGYQTRINRALRASMLRGLRRQRAAKKSQTAAQG